MAIQLPLYDTGEGYEAPIDPVNDSIKAKAFVPVAPNGTAAEGVAVSRDNAGNLIFTDTPNGSVTLSDALAGGGGGGADDTAQALIWMGW